MPPPMTRAAASVRARLRPRDDGRARPAALIATVVLGIVVCTAVAIATFGHAPGAAKVSYAGQTVAAVVAALGGASGATRARGTNRLVWVMFSVAAGAICVGTAIDFGSVLRGAAINTTTSAGSIAEDVSAPLILTGILLMVRIFLRVGRVRTIVDSLLGLVAVCALGWAFGLHDLWAASAQPTVDKLLTLATPAGDVLYLTPTIFIGLAVARRHRPALAAMAAALAATLVTDVNVAAAIITGHPDPGGRPYELGWTVSLLLIGLGGMLMPPVLPEDTEPQRPTMLRTALPYLAVASCGLVTAGQLVTGGHTDPAMVAMLVVLVLFLTVRQVIELRDNLELSEELRVRSVRSMEARFRALLQHSSDITVLVDPALAVQFVTPAVEDVVGLRVDEVLGGPFTRLVHPEDAEAVAAALRAIAAGEPGDAALTFRGGALSGSRWRHLEARTTNLLEEPVVGGIVLNIRDVTERRELEEQLRRDALHDALTGLANRTLLVDRTQHALDLARRQGGRVAVLFIDLDDFKHVNDTAGHAAGDELLRTIARRLRSAVRAADTPARFGGDEFAILLNSCETARDALAVAAKVLAAVRIPVEIEGRPYRVGASIGVALSRGDAESVEEVMRRADGAMYRAKQRGKNVAVLDGAEGLPVAV